MNLNSNKLPMRSRDMTADQIEKIGSLFPHVIVEIEGEDGTIRKGIDFDLLRQELSDEIVEGREERYEFTWVGKRRSIVEGNTPIQKTLRPCIPESKDWENTQNIFIEGDNLDALKLLQESYLNSVKMTYIDPSYNTGNDFIYNDSFVMDSDEYDEESGAVDEAGNRMFKNGKDRGRYHSDWCSMLYPRLKLAKNLLRDDGVIFISIDDNEVHNLRKMMDEVFGEENFVANMIWQKRTSPDARATIGAAHDSIIVYSRLLNCFKPTLQLLPLSENRLSDYTNPDNDPRGPWASRDITGQTGHATPSQFYEITTSNGNKYYPPDGRCWAISETTLLQLIKCDKIWFGKEGNSRPTLKLFLYKSKGMATWTWWPNNEVGHNQEATQELNLLMGVNDIFDNPKPTKLITRILQLITAPTQGDIILDFFAGSCTTAHAIINLNNGDNGYRKYILIQLAESCSIDTDAFKAEYKTIADIGKERIRRSGEQIKKQIEEENTQSTLDGSPKPIPDIGFRVFKIDDTNMKDVYYAATDYSQETIEGLIDNVKTDRSDLDLLYQVLLSWGLKLDLTHTIEKIDNFTIHHIDPENKSLIACFDSNISEDVMRKIAMMTPLRAVFRDGSFRDSPDKLNIEDIFKTLSPNTTVRVI